MDKRRLVLIGTQSGDLQRSLRTYFDNHIEGSVVFIAGDGTDLLIKASRTKPNLVIFSHDLQRTSSVDVYRHLRQEFPRDPVAYLYLGPELPSSMKDDHSMGRLVWVQKMDPSGIAEGIAHALNSIGESSSHFSVKHLAQGETLMTEGEESGFFYFVINGSLSAATMENNEPVELGMIRAGEFVGEMGVINDERRTATVRCEEACQLLEIPARDFSRVILSKPSWAKALMSTLTKRLKSMNIRSKRI